jgi:mitochondrial GTPase 1
MAHQFRKKFKLVNRDLIRWFPGHMAKGEKQMQQKLKGVDCIIEVHDSRIPFSGRNHNLHYSLLSAKPSILVLNKKDLIPSSIRPKILSELKAIPDFPSQSIFFTNCKDHQDNGVKKLIPKAIELISGSERFNRQNDKENTIMVVGVPNTGKSSLINALRNRFLKKKNAAAVGAVAGITRSVLTRIKVSEDPPIYLLDTPGVLMPNIKEIEQGMKLALCSCFKDDIVGEELIADYLLYFLNKTGNFGYCQFIGLEEPTDDISLALLTLAKGMNQTMKVRDLAENQLIVRPNITAAAAHFIKAFRNGQFGPAFLDDNYIKNYQTEASVAQ